MLHTRPAFKSLPLLIQLWTALNIPSRTAVAIRANTARPVLASDVTVVCYEMLLATCVSASGIYTRCRNHHRHHTHAQPLSFTQPRTQRRSGLVKHRMPPKRKTIMARWFVCLANHGVRQSCEISEGPH